MKIIIFTALFPSLLYAQNNTRVTTYFSAPFGNYRDLSISNALTASIFSMFGNSTIIDPLLDVLDVNSNLIGGWDSTTSGGNLRVTGNVDIQDSGGNSLFFVDSLKGNVGIGTRTPRAALEVVPDITGLIITANQDVADWTYKPWAEMFAQVELPADSFDSATPNSGYGAKFGATFKDNDWRTCSLYIDANPLVFQTQLKTGITAAHGLGQVVIRGFPDPTNNDLILIVGEPDPTVYATATPVPLPMPVTRANAWNPIACSRVYKKDIVPFSLTDYKETLNKLSNLEIVSYHYKMEKKAAKLHTGVIAEDAPIDIVSADRKSVSLQNEAGILLASLKALKIENQKIRERIARLQQ